MKLLGYELRDFTSPAINGVFLYSDMRKAIEDWLKNGSTYNLKDCSTDRDVRHVLGMFQEIKERTGANSIQMIEYFYSLEKQIEDLKIKLEEFVSYSD